MFFCHCYVIVHYSIFSPDMLFIAEGSRNESLGIHACQLGNEPFCSYPLCSFILCCALSVQTSQSFTLRKKRQLQQKAYFLLENADFLPVAENIEDHDGYAFAGTFSPR